MNLSGSRASMHIIHVQIRVKAECVDAFMAATRINAEFSRLEPGLARFDVIQEQEDPTRFVLVEVYSSPADHAAHRETKHYAQWRDTVTALMAENRTAKKYVNVSPDDGGW
ncbi:MAG TPA: antibiotic biosynthesis monooxygenase [Opitutaceae bacterium]|jgi:quinol monooxygenase YgiN